MKIALIMVKGEPYSFKKLLFGAKASPDSLTLPMLYSIIHNAFPDVEIDIYDETFEKIKKENIEADIIGISAITPAYYKAVELSKYFRAKGIPVFVGGAHASLVPEDCMEDFDSVISGLANDTLVELINDFKNNNLKKIYRQHPDMSFKNFVLPERNLYSNLKKYRYNEEITTVQATYGCSNICKFCVQPFICKGYHQRPVEDVIEEIRQIKSRNIEFYDPNLTKDFTYLRNLCAGLLSLKKQWMAPMTISIANNEEYLKMIKQAGCKAVLIGFESINPDSIDAINKGFNNIAKYKMAVSRFHKYGIMVIGSFVTGLDGDNKNTLKYTLNFIKEANIDVPRFTINTPYPGTEFYKEMKDSGRLLTEDLKYYDCMHCVIQPNNLTPKQVEKIFFKMWREAYKFINVIKRLSYIKSLPKRLLYAIAVYLVGKRYAKRAFKHRLKSKL